MRRRVAPRSKRELAELFEAHGLPFAPITRPHELLEDPHLLATGGLAPITLPDGERAGQTVSTVPLPFTLHGQRLAVKSPPRLGEHSAEVLASLGYDDAAIQRLSRVARKVPGQG